MQPAVREQCHVLRHLLCKIPGILNLKRVWGAAWDIIGISDSSGGPKYLWWAWDRGVSWYHLGGLFLPTPGNSADKKVIFLQFLAYISWPQIIICFTFPYPLLFAKTPDKQFLEL